MRLVYRLNPRSIGLILSLIAAYLALQSLIAEYLIENVLDGTTNQSLILVIDLFSVNAEQTIPTWYSMMLLFFAAVALAFIAAGKYTSRGRYTAHWAGLAVVFVYLSVDESAAIHEIVADWLQTTYNPTGYLTFAWYVVAVPLAILFVLVYLRFLLHLPRRTRNLFILAGFIYVGGAVAVEAVSANQYFVGGGVTFEYLAIATVEELCEMLGVVVFIYALLAYIAEMRYALAIEPQPDLRSDPIADATDDAPRAARTFPSRRLAFSIVFVIVGMNMGLAYWAFTQAPAPNQQNAPADPAQTLIDQLAAGDVLVTRMTGVFSPENLTARRVSAALLDLFDEVMVVTLMSTETSLALASDELPFDRDGLIDILHANGEIQFIIFDTPAVIAITADPQR